MRHRPLAEHPPKNDHRALSARYESEPWSLRHCPSAAMRRRRKHGGAALPFPPRIDWPDIDERVAADEVAEVVQVDCRVAVRRHQLDAFAEGWDRIGL